MLILTPVVWMHYLVFPFVAVAVVSPTFASSWALPLALWISPREGPSHTWQSASVLVVAATVLVSAYRAAEPSTQTDASAAATTA